MAKLAQNALARKKGYLPNKYYLTNKFSFFSLSHYQCCTKVYGSFFFKVACHQRLSLQPSSRKTKSFQVDRLPPRPSSWDPRLTFKLVDYHLVTTCPTLNARELLTCLGRTSYSRMIYADDVDQIFRNALLCCHIPKVGQICSIFKENHKKG